MQIKIERLDEYEMYLKKHLKNIIKDDKHRSIVIDEFLIVFSDGMDFAKGKLIVKVEDE